MDDMELKYYNKEVHSAAFALPRFVQKVSDKSRIFFVLKLCLFISECGVISTTLKFRGSV